MSQNQNQSQTISTSAVPISVIEAATEAGAALYSAVDVAKVPPSRMLDVLQALDNLQQFAQPTVSCEHSLGVLASLKSHVPNEGEVVKRLILDALQLFRCPTPQASVAGVADADTNFIESFVDRFSEDELHAIESVLRFCQMRNPSQLNNNSAASTKTVATNTNWSVL